MTYIVYMNGNKICPKCSGAVPDDSVFCNYCGKRLTASPRKASDSAEWWFTASLST